MIEEISYQFVFTKSTSIRWVQNVIKNNTNISHAEKFHHTHYFISLICNIYREDKKSWKQKQENLIVVKLNYREIQMKEFVETIGLHYLIHFVWNLVSIMRLTLTFHPSSRRLWGIFTICGFCMQQHSPSTWSDACCWCFFMAISRCFSYPLFIFWSSCRHRSCVGECVLHFKWSSINHRFHHLKGIVRSTKLSKMTAVQISCSFSSYSFSKSSF